MVPSRLSSLIPTGQVALVAHDSGGAEVLSSWIQRNPRKYRLVLGGAGRKIFERDIGLDRETTVVEAVSTCDWVLTGSSWQSDLELSAIQYARDKGKYVITFLDHWINYRARLLRNGQLITPNEVWVGDEYAYELAKRELPEVLRIRQVTNSYIVESVGQIKKQEVKVAPGKVRILYVCENISEHALSGYGDEFHWGYTEYDAIRYCLRELSSSLINHIELLTIRLHPSESTGKYSFVQREFSDLPLVFSENDSLIEQISTHNWVIGCNTTAMVLAALGGRRGISCIPPGGRQCVLPYKEIELWHDQRPLATECWKNNNEKNPDKES